MLTSITVTPHAPPASDQGATKIGCGAQDKAKRRFGTQIRLKVGTYRGRDRFGAQDKV